MRRPLRIALLSLAAAAGLLLAGVAVLVARFDGDALAAVLVERLQRGHDRQLRFTGDLTLRLWPRLADGCTSSAAWRRWTAPPRRPPPAQDAARAGRRAHR